MAETCIVCLGDLAGLGGEQVPHQTSATVNELRDESKTHQADTCAKSPSNLQPDDEETIAHLLPCGHNLHNACLKPWVQRANSCPICRASFNMVELCTSVGGMCCHAYTPFSRRKLINCDRRSALVVLHGPRQATKGRCRSNHGHRRWR
jgi:hypothetical protein